METHKEAEVRLLTQSKAVDMGTCLAFSGPRFSMLENGVVQGPFSGIFN